MDYVLVMPEDEAEREALAVEIASDLNGAEALAAGITYTQGDPDAGGMALFVLASDSRGETEAWAAEIVRRDELPPRIGDWQRVSAGGAFMFALHAAVMNVAGMRQLVMRHGLPPAFAAQIPAT